MAAARSGRRLFLAGAAFLLLLVAFPSAALAAAPQVTSFTPTSGKVGRGPAVVFEDVHDVQARIDDSALEVEPDSVLVLRNSGPKGGPGMPEWGQVPIPKKLLERGVTDLVRVSDARMSGTAFGTVVLHVAPESAAGGPLRAVEDGDPIVLDVEERRIDLDVAPEEVRRRLDRLGPPEPKYRRGYGALYLDHVLQADEGCDFDFLRSLPGEPAQTEPLGLLSGWVGGW